MNGITIGRVAAWAPALGSLASAKDQWRAWAAGRTDGLEEADTTAVPALEFTDPLFRRRLSQLTRMTIQVVHDLVEVEGDEAGTAALKALPLVFVSFRGELAQQYKINRMLVEDSSLTPAAFSHSVFNTPIALACIAMKLTAGYQALYPGGNLRSPAVARWNVPAAGKDAFRTALLSAASPVLAGSEKGVILVYGDERIADSYAALRNTAPGNPEDFPMAFAVELRPAGAQEGISSPDLFQLPAAETPGEFLKYCLNIH